MTTNNKPVFKATIGFITASVWRNSKDGIVMYSTDITRSYRDKEGNWQSVSAFNHDDLLNVAKLAERAESFIAKDKQASTT